MKFIVKKDMVFAHPLDGDPQNFRILEANTIITSLAPPEMTTQMRESLAVMKKRDAHNKRRVGFNWLGRFRTGIIGDDLSPYRSSGVISKRNW